MTDQQFAIYPSLRGRTVFVTGGATGIGAAIVGHFCAQGADTWFVDLNVEAGEALAASMMEKGEGAAHFLACDLRDIDGLRAAIGTAGDAPGGPVRVLVNNAASDDRHALESVTPDYFDERVAVNIKHQLFAAQAVAPGMAAAGGGAVVNMGSVSYMLGQGGMPVYSLSKSAVWGLTRSLARDLGPDNIRVNMVVPGWVMTERQRTLWLTPEGDAQIMAGQCLKQYLMPDDLARAVLFFAADDSAMCTGQSYIVDGGWA